MKNKPLKILPFFLSFAFVLSGCSSENENTQASESETTQTVSEVTSSGSITEADSETEAETEAVTESETSSETAVFLKMPRQEYYYTNICDEERISGIMDYISPINAKELITDEAFTEEIMSELPLLEVNKKSLIHGLDEIYISCCGVNTFSLNQNAPIPKIQCFVFNGDLENIGTVDFIRRESNTFSNDLSIFVIGESGNTEYSETFEILSEEKDRKYAFILYGVFGEACIDEENSVKYFGENIDKELEIIGNPYSIFDKKGLTVSYDDITDEENLIKFEVEELG